jgi:hypothetical protein
MEPTRSHSDDGVGLLNDYDFSTEDDHRTRTICGHRKSPVPGRIVSALTSETGQYSKRDCNGADDLGGIPSIVRAVLLDERGDRIRDNGAQAYSTGTTVPNCRAERARRRVDPDLTAAR